MLMVTIWSVFACLNYVINPSANLLMLSSNLAWLAHQNGKKTHVVPIHEKNHKHYVKNYRPVSLLPICSNILKRIIYNTLFKHFIDNNLISENQSGSKPGDSCVNQLWAITHEIFSSFDDNYEMIEILAFIHHSLYNTFLQTRLLLYIIHFYTNSLIVFASTSSSSASTYSALPFLSTPI